MERQPLVLLPGLLNDAGLWVHQTTELSDIAEMHIPGLHRYDTIPAMAEAALAEAPPTFSLAGLSMGGYVALEIMRQSPERVERLALFDTSARADTEAQKARRRGFIEQSGTGRFKGVTPRLLPMLIHKDRLEDPIVVDGIFQMAARVGRDGFINQQTAIMGRSDSLDLLATIKCPTIVCVGRQDNLTPPPLAEEMADGILGAKLRIIEECGHLPALEQPEETTEILEDWLTW